MPKPDTKLNYILKDIPRPLWDRAKHRIVDERILLRDLLIKSLAEYLDRVEAK